jgi:cytidine deaminase
VIPEEVELTVLDDTTRQKLIVAARDASRNAYCPHSNFRVGAAVLANGHIFTGCNIENDSFSLTMCAERVAVFTAIAAGNRQISAIAISCPDVKTQGRIEEEISCGACRQVLSQFGSEDLVVMLNGNRSLCLGEMFPKPFKLPTRQVPSPNQPRSR